MTGARIDEEPLDARTLVLAVRGESEALDSDWVVARLSETQAERIILDLTGSRHTEAGLGDALSAASDRFGESARTLVVVSADPDLRQALGLAAGEALHVAASRDEALRLLGEGI